MRKIIQIGLFSAALLVTGCSTTLKSTNLSEGGYFSTNAKIVYDGVKKKEEFKEKYKTLLYVKTDEKNKQFNSFYIETFKNMNVFEKVYDKELMENMVFEKKLTGSVFSISDKIGLHSLQKHIGPFLVVEPYVEWVKGYEFKAELKAYDPETGKDVLVIENKAFNWAGLDKPLFYPLFNAFLEWVRGEEITTKPEINTSESK